MNQKLKKQIVKSLTVLFSATALLTTTNSLTSHAMLHKDSANKTIGHYNHDLQYLLNGWLVQAAITGDEKSVAFTLSQGANKALLDDADLLEKNRQILDNMDVHFLPYNYSYNYWLKQAILVGHKNSVSFLLDQCCAYIDDSNCIGWPDLLINAMAGRINYVKESINKLHEDINITNNRGETALILASKYDNTEIVDFLLENKEINVNARDNEGHTALYYAKSNEIIKLLTQHGGIKE